MERRVLTIFLINNAPLKACLVLHSSSLNQVRTQLGIDIYVQFSIDGAPIETPSESEIQLSDIAKDNKVYLIKIAPTQVEVDFFKNGKPYVTKAVSFTISLAEARL